MKFTPQICASLNIVDIFVISWKMPLWEKGNINRFLLYEKQSIVEKFVVEIR